MEGYDNEQLIKGYSSSSYSKRLLLSRSSKFSSIFAKIMAESLLLLYRTMVVFVVFGNTKCSTMVIFICLMLLLLLNVAPSVSLRCYPLYTLKH